MNAPRNAYLQDAAGLLERGLGWSGLPGDSLAFVLTEVAATGRWLLVVDGPDRADQLTRALRFFGPPTLRVEPFPADDQRPYDGFSPDPALPRQRLRTLELVDRGGDLLVVAPVQALLQRVPAPQARARGTRTLVPEGEVDRDALASWLTEAGYLLTSRADEPGRFAVRGDVVDVWPASARAPVRIDLFDDEIESLRRLDPATLRPVRGKRGVAGRITLLPAREERLDALAVEHASEVLGRLVVSQQEGAPRRKRVLDDLRAGVRFSAVQDWLPALVPTVAPRQALEGLRPVVFMPDDVAAAARDLQATAQRRYEALEPEERPMVPPSERYVPAADVLRALDDAHVVSELPSDRAADLGARPASDLVVRGADLGPLAARLREMQDAEVRVGLVVESRERADRLFEMLEPHGIVPKRVEQPRALGRGDISVLVGDLPRGFLAPESGWAFLPVSVLFGAARRRVAERAHALFDGPVTTMAQLKLGDPVVHRLHGVGLYRGLERVELQGGVAQDFVKLEYRDGQHLFLPVAALEQLSRYTTTSSDAKVVLDRLGGQTWEKRKGRVRDNLLGMAQELISLHARRELATRRSLGKLGPRYRAFEARFPHEETPDQADAINAVLHDLDKPYPMDRLVCGDVGFGKTEVAMRAAMRVVEAGRQVAVLCPTTVLAYQHHRSFVERFSADPQVTVGMLSRFASPEDEAKVLRGLADGSVDIVIGTTAILGRRVRFAEFGLVVVDEEHRFGVKQKERFKRMRAEVDFLAMSATPIPRTLQMAMSGVREMSLIATPPTDRLAVRTSVAKLSETRVRDAVMAEIERGGQVFVVHNRVETIASFANKLRGWLPGVDIAVGHGQMGSEELERVLVQFIEGRADVLLSTAIIESGIDLPNVNTMLVHRADLFGLAQLHQLRGRVGRSDRRAQCLLLVPETITPEARKRLRVVVDNQRLGSGFAVASADLELRGGGNLLGSAQSGNIDQVGYETWVELLEEAVHVAKGDLDRQRIDPEVEVPVDAFLPDDYVRDTQERLGWYKRLASAGSPGEVEGLLDDLEGEFGALPPPASNLGGLMITRLLCRQHGVVRVSVLRVRAVLLLHTASPLLDGGLERTLARHPKRFERSSRDPLEVSVRFTPRESEQPFRFLRWVFAQLSRPDEP